MHVRLTELTACRLSARLPIMLVASIGLLQPWQWDGLRSSFMSIQHALATYKQHSHHLQTHPTGTFIRQAGWAADVTLLPLTLVAHA